MSAIKCELEDRIMELAEEGGYDFDDLMEQYWDYVRECRKDGEPIDWDYFAGVTKEQDW